MLDPMKALMDCRLPCQLRSPQSLTGLPHPWLQRCDLMHLGDA